MFLWIFYINKKGINIESDKKREIMRYRISVLLQAEQKGIRSSDVGRAVVQKDRRKFWIDTL